MEREELKNLIKDVSSLMSISGFVRRNYDEFSRLLGEGFDEIYGTPTGGMVLIRRCGKKNAPVILVDTHLDEIGMMVTEVLERGFLRITSVGGLDTRILQSGEVAIWGGDGKENRTFYGVVSSTPPHLQSPGEAEKLKPVGELFIDTGLSDEEAKKFIRPGTPVGFYPVYTDLQNGMIAGKGVDDKACAACAAAAIRSAAKEELWGDVYLQLSNFEEDGSHMGGAAAGAFAIDPDCALTVDVKLGKTPDTKSSETVVMCAGPSLTLSPFTDRALTLALASAAEEAGVKYQYSVVSRSAGTNADVINVALRGIPTVDAGLPLKSMHTSCEVISMEDAEDLCRLVTLFVTSGKVRDAL